MGCWLSLVLFLQNEDEEGVELPSTATDTETEKVTVDATPSAEEIAAATKLQGLARGSQVRAEDHQI